MSRGVAKTVALPANNNVLVKLQGHFVKWTSVKQEINESWYCDGCNKDPALSLISNLDSLSSSQERPGSCFTPPAMDLSLSPSLRHASSLSPSPSSPSSLSPSSPMESPQNSSSPQPHLFSRVSPCVCWSTVMLPLLSLMHFAISVHTRKLCFACFISWDGNDFNLFWRFREDMGIKKIWIEWLGAVYLACKASDQINTLY